MLIVNDSSRMAVYNTCFLITLVIRKSFLPGCLASSAHDKVAGLDCKGQFPSAPYMARVICHRFRLAPNEEHFFGTNNMLFSIV